MTVASERPINALLDRMGPEECERMDQAQARAWCANLAGGRYENFPVLSRLLPASAREDFAAIYAFCRWADDLGDESGDATRALELLAWWRRELQACFAGEPRHPVFVALLPTIRAHDLPMQLFDHLIQAFELDNRRNRWSTMHELLQSCALSADPVGRLVLMTLGQQRDEVAFAQSDAICTALQLVNHWQDVRRDLLQRDRIYIPHERTQMVSDFESRLRISATQGFAPDREFLAAYRKVLRGLCDETEALFVAGEPLLEKLSDSARPVVGLFAAGGRGVLGKIRAWDYETCLRRPRLGAAHKASMVACAWWQSRKAAR